MSSPNELPLMKRRLVAPQAGGGWGDWVGHSVPAIGEAGFRRAAQFGHEEHERSLWWARVWRDRRHFGGAGVGGDPGYRVVRDPAARPSWQGADGKSPLPSRTDPKVAGHHRRTGGTRHPAAHGLGGDGRPAGPHGHQWIPVK